MTDTTNTELRPTTFRRCHDVQCPMRKKCYWGIVEQEGNTDYERKVDAPSCWAFYPAKGTKHYNILQSNRTRGVHPGNRSPEPKRRLIRKGNAPRLLGS